MVSIQYNLEQEFYSPSHRHDDAHKVPRIHFFLFKELKIKSFKMSKNGRLILTMRIIKSQNLGVAQTVAESLIIALTFLYAEIRNTHLNTHVEYGETKDEDEDCLQMTQNLVIQIKYDKKRTINLHPNWPKSLQYRRLNEYIFIHIK